MAYTLDDIGNAPGQIYDFLKRKYVSLTKPDEDGDYSSRKSSISRQQKLAEALSQMGAQEEEVSTVGGITAPVSGMGALARGLTSFGGSYLSGKAAADEAALKKEEETETTDTIKAAIKAASPKYTLNPVEKSTLPNISGAAISTGDITPMNGNETPLPPSSYNANAELANIPSAFGAPRQPLNSGYTGVSGQSYMPGSQEEAANIFAASKIPSLRDKGLEMIFGRQKMGAGDVMTDNFGNVIGNPIPTAPKNPNYQNNPEEDFIIQTGVDKNGKPYQFKINKADIPMRQSNFPPTITSPLEAKNHPDSPTVLVDGVERTNPFYRGQ